MATDGLAGIAAGGDRVETLRALRDRLAAEIDVCDSTHVLAALSQRLMDVLAQIAEVERAQPAKEGTALDELARRRSPGQASRSAGATQRH